MKVVVTRNDLKYRVDGFNRGRSFIPKAGDVLDLPKTIAKRELRTNNVRLPLEEEEGKDSRFKDLKKKKKKKKK